jgi:serine/threonine protein kinase/tetratricopeptide (TPR) repeat protein
VGVGPSYVCAMDAPRPEGSAPDLRQHLEATLGSAYTIERELGGGGMSRVFLAQETALERRVVVKVLAPGLAQELSIERFAREIRVSARLQHPNIVPVLAAGAFGGVPYYTMPYVDGQSLRARIKSVAAGGRVPLGESLVVLREVARALAYAHGHGVVHRDIKPENVLLADDAVLVADFGIAKAIDAARTSSDDATLTQLGTSLGTPAYMSPEQIACDPTVDHRADLYAWGVVAYELLSGAHPFADKRSPRALVAAHLAELPASLGAARPDLPPTLVTLVMRCLAKDPAHRPDVARELVDTLGRLTFAAEASASPGPPAPAAAARRTGDTSGTTPSIAVLPFANVSGDAENEPFSDGLTDELIGALGKLGGLKVAGRTSTFALKGRGLDVRTIADTLGVATVLEGSVRRSRQRLKVSVQLVSAGDEGVLWAETYDRELADVFAVQEDIAQSIVAALRVKLHGVSDARIVERAPASLEAYELYLKGRFVRRRLRPADLLQAIHYYEQAIERDPSYVRAYAALADTHILLSVFAARPARVEVPRARAYAERALALDDTHAEAHFALAHVLFVSLEWEAAEREFLRTLAIDPGHAEARHLRAIYLLDLSRFDEALSELTRTLETDPVFAAASMTVGVVYLSMGQLDKAVHYEREALALAPEFSYARGHLGQAYLLQGKHDEAIAELERAAATGAAADAAKLAYGYAVVGRRAEAETHLQAVLDAGDGVFAPLHIAMAYVGLGNTDEAFRWLERAFEERDPHVLGLNIIPAFRTIRSDPRFADLVRRMGIIA